MRRQAQHLRVWVRSQSLARGQNTGDAAVLYHDCMVGELGVLRLNRDDPAGRYHEVCGLWHSGSFADMKQKSPARAGLSSIELSSLLLLLRSGDCAFTPPVGLQVCDHLFLAHPATALVAGIFLGFATAFVLDLVRRDALALEVMLDCRS